MQSIIRYGNGVLVGYEQPVLHSVKWLSNKTGYNAHTNIRKTNFKVR